MGLRETAILSEVKVIYKQKGPITFMTPNDNFSTFALENGKNPQTVSQLLREGSRMTPCPHAEQQPGDFATQNSVSKKACFVAFFSPPHLVFATYTDIVWQTRPAKSPR